MKKFIEEHQSGAGKKMAVGVSGGPDSMALCHMLSRAMDADIHAITVDHGLRPEAADEAAQVGQWVKSWPHVTHAVLTRAAGRGTSSRIQETARQDRYKLIAEYCRKHDIGGLFLAHHLDDQAETFLFRLAKGSGLDGLAAMRAVQFYEDDLILYRPLLAVSRSEITDYCAAHDVPYIRDPSNDDTAFARVRLRGAAEILAREGLTPKRLGVTAARMGRARRALETYTDEAFSRISNIKTNRIEYNLDSWRTVPEEIRLRLLLKAMAAIDKQGGTARDYNPRMEKLESLLCRIDTDSGFKRATLGGFMFARNDKNGLVVIEKEDKGAT